MASEKLKSKTVKIEKDNKCGWHFFILCTKIKKSNQIELLFDFNRMWNCAEPSRVEPSRVNTSRAESSRAEPIRFDLTRFILVRFGSVWFYLAQLGLVLDICFHSL